MAEPKTKKTDASVEAFLKIAAGPQRLADCRVVAKMMREATGSAPKMWGASIVGFGNYTYGAGKKAAQWPLVAFSPRKAELVLYIMPGFGEYDALMARLGPHKTGKSCLYLKSLDGIDRKALQALIGKSVAAMRSRHPE